MPADGASQRVDPAETGDDAFCLGHRGWDIRLYRIFVNVEIVDEFFVWCGQEIRSREKTLIKPEEVPTTIKRLRERAGLSMEQMARAMALAAGSSYQNYETRERHTYLKLTLARHLLATLVGKGNPPIRRCEVMALAGIEEGETIDRRVVTLCIEIGMHKFMRASQLTPGCDAAVFGEAARRIAEAAMQLTEDKRSGRVRGDAELRAYVEGLIQGAVQQAC